MLIALGIMLVSGISPYLLILEAIRKGLSRSENTIKVYEIISQNKEIAVFGVGLKEKKEGEAYFLPIIGESHVAYELILQGNEITIFYGRYRFPLHWTELTMKTFTMIRSRLKLFD